MRGSSNDVVEIDAELREDRPRAYLIYDGKTECWLPKSQVEFEPRMGSESGVFKVPVWLAKEKGLV